MRRPLLLFIAVASLLLAGCGSGEEGKPPPLTLPPPVERPAVPSSTATSSSNPGSKGSPYLAQADAVRDQVERAGLPCSGSPRRFEVPKSTFGVYPKASLDCSHDGTSIHISVYADAEDVRGALMVTQGAACSMGVDYGYIDGGGTWLITVSRGTSNQTSAVLTSEVAEGLGLTARTLPC